MKLLHVDSSILGDASASRAVTGRIVDAWRNAVPGIEVRHVDLAAAPLPHFSPESLSGTQADSAALDDFLAADVIVLGAPMYNFSIPSQLKAWIDRIAVRGKTFRYTENGPEGLAGGKRVIVAVSRGGVYSPGAFGEHVEPYLRDVFAFLGITDLTFVRAEGLAISPESRDKGLTAALASIPEPSQRAAA